MYYHPEKQTMKRFVGAVLCLVLASLPALAGIPKPSLILYGKVFNGQGDLLTTGTLSWSFVPAEGGAPVEVVTTLQAFDGPDGPFSYKALVPLETPVAGYPASGSAVPVATAAAEYNQTATVVGSTITFTQDVIISQADVGSAKRVDVCTTCPANTAEFHTADLNRDLKFSLSEFLRVIELHSATPTHEYHVLGKSTDGFGLGPGPRSGIPHSIDYYGGADWRVTVHELVRMVDLFTATPDHSYHPSDLAEDGFNKGVPSSGDKAQYRFSSAALGGDGEDLALTRHAVAGVDGLIEVTVTLNGVPGDTITGFGVHEALPAGWRYHSLRGGTAPFVSPRAGKTGRLEFAWFPAPSGPFQFSYGVRPADGAKSGADAELISGAGVYRTQFSESEALLAIAPVAGPPSELGGDDGSGDGAGDEEGSGSGGTGDGSGTGAGSGTEDDDLLAGNLPGDNGVSSGSGSGSGDGEESGDAVSGSEDEGGPPALPVSGSLGLGILATLLGAFVWRRSRKHAVD